MAEGTGSTDRWERVKRLFHELLEVDPAARVRFLDENCEDGDIRRDVESLLEAFDSAGSFLERGPGAAAIDHLLRPGDRLGAYQVERLIGAGGMGSVYEAARADGEFQQRVAIKVMRGAAVGSAAKRFRAERQILADIDHPYIARLLDGGTTEDGAPYFIMEHIRGEPIDRYCDRHRLSVPERLRLLCQVCDAVQHAHELKVVHRDLKPGNVLVTEHGTPKLLDFGIAKLLEIDPNTETADITLQGGGPMTPSFASPEQIQGEPITGATDVYSLGIIAYLLVAGMRPYDIDGLPPGRVADVICQADIIPPSRKVANSAGVSRDPSEGAATGSTTGVDATTRDERARLRSILGSRRIDLAGLLELLQGDLDAILMRALARNPADRYPSPAAFSRALQQYLSGIGGEHARPMKPRMSRGRKVAAVAAAGLLGAAALSAVWRFSNGAAETADVAIRNQRPVVTWASNEFDGRLSPDHRSISFIAAEGDRRTLWIRPTNWDAPVQVASEMGTLASHMWAPDSSRIAYLVVDAREALIRIVDTDGQINRTIPLALRNPALVRWMGDSLYFLSNGSLWRIDVDGTRLTQMPSPARALYYSSLDINARSDAIVFAAADESGQVDLWTAGLDGTDLERLTDDPAIETNVRWYGDDGAAICVTNEGGRLDIWLTSPDGEKSRLTATASRERSLDVSRDGSLLVVDSIEESSDIWLLGPDGGTPAPLTSDDLADFFPEPAAAADLIAFQRSRPSPDELEGPFDGNVFVLDTSTRNAVPVLRVEAGFAPALSFDGAWLSYLARRRGQDALELHVVGADGAEIGSGLPFLAPTFSVFPLEWESLALKWGTTAPNLYYVRGAADDGQELVLRAVDPRGVMGPETVLAASRPLESITAIAVSPDESEIAFVVDSRRRAGATEVRILTTRTGQVREVLSESAAALHLAGWADADTIVVLRSEFVAGGRQRSQVLALGIDGAPTTIGTLDGAIPQTARVGVARSIFLTAADDEGIFNIHALPLTGGEPQPVTANTLPNVAFGGIHVTRAGALVYTRQHRTSNVWFLELQHASSAPDREE